MKRLLALLVVVGFLVVTAAPANAQATSLSVKWKRLKGHEVNLCLDDPQGRLAVYRAAATWSTDQFIAFHYRTSSCPAISHSVRIITGNYGATGWLGTTTFYLGSDGFLDHILIRFNTYYSWAYHNYLRALACHELGHSLGLGHNTLTSSCMYHVVLTAYPNGEDFSMLNHIYVAAY